jgi:PAS domain S-box-containing protein
MEEKASFPLGRVLVVDDEPQLLSVLCEMITGLGYEATGFLTAKEALGALLENSYDILLTDIIMPEMDGVQLLHTASQSDPYLVGVLMTGQRDIQTAVEAIQIGAFDYIQKPFNQVTLFSVFTRAMKVRKLRIENLQLHETIGIHELAKTIAVAPDIDTVLNKLADAAQRLTEADEVSILLPIDGNAKELCVAVARGVHLTDFAGMNIPTEDTIAGWVAGNHETVTLDGTLRDDRFQSAHLRDDFGSAISMPILTGGKFLGVLNVKTTQGRRRFVPGQIKGLSILVSLVAPILESSHLYQEARLAEERYRDIFDNAIEGIYQVTPAKVFVSANKALAQIYGYDLPEDLISGVHDIEQELYVKPSLYSAFVDTIVKQGSVTNYEAQHFRKDRSIIWVELNARVIYDSNGELLFYEGSCEDITARKNAEEALQRERFTLMQFIDNLPILAYGISRDGIIINCNSMAVYTLGYENKDELIGKPATVLYAPECRDNVLEMIKRWEKEGNIKNEEFKLITKRGKILDVLLNVHSIPGEKSNPLNFIVTQLDITERKIMEEKLKETVSKLKKATGGIIEVLVTAVEARDPYTAGHQKRVAELASAIARIMGLSPEMVNGLQMSGMIHDLGKMSVPAEILSLPRQLNALEYSLVKVHPAVGYKILKDIDFQWPVAQIVLQHHERLDGSGYPHGLMGNRIDLGAQILAVADTVEAMVSHRPYRPSLGVDAALKEIEENKGVLYNVDAVNACLQLSRKEGLSFVQNAQ